MRLTAWRLFCAEQRLDPAVCWCCLPGLDRIKRAEKAAEQVAFTREDFDQWCARSGRGVAVTTAEDLAAGLRESLKSRAV
jgi:hypothetical protein